MIKIEVWHVNGDYQDFNEPTSIIAKLESLKKAGYVGKSLIHELLTDDWGPPPLKVKLSGKGPNGKMIEETIPYR